MENGKINFKKSEEQVKFTQETIGSVRELTINNNQESFLKDFILLMATKILGCLFRVLQVLQNFYWNF